jgi:DEAD/DEAH box helicase domain-containing protein
MPVDILYFDIETQKSAADVGGWNNKHLMRVSFAVTYSTRDERFFGYEEKDVPALIAALSAAEQVIGYNVIGFDYGVLSAYTSLDFSRLPTLDLMADVALRLGFRPKLDDLAQATLQMGKSADGLTALRWFREGRFAEIALYCQEDVRVTRDLHRFGCDHGYIFYPDKKQKPTRLDVAWGKGVPQR